MMKSQEHKRTVCLFFHIHQPFRLKTYRFFNIGLDHNYFNEENNRNLMRRIANNSYLPANEAVISLIKKLGSKFKVTFGISGTALEQLIKYAPRVLDSFMNLFKTGNIEFVAESYACSLAILKNVNEYKRQVRKHLKIIEDLFMYKPVVFAHANLLYSDYLAQLAQELGFKAVLAEGAQQALEWKSPNYLYSSKSFPSVKLLLRNYDLSDDISIRYSRREWNQWPLTADKYISWLNSCQSDQKLINLFFDYSAFGEYQSTNSGILLFFQSFVEKLIESGKWEFRTVSEVAGSIEPIAQLQVPEYISWADQDRDLSAWLGNDLQKEAFDALYTENEIMEKCEDQELLSDWEKLQTCDHFFYMSTKYLNNCNMHRPFSPYTSPYEAFLNYMNVVSDFNIRAIEYSARPSAKEIRQKEYEPELEEEQYMMLTL